MSETFDPTLRVNYRTDTLRDDTDSLRDIRRIENIKKNMPGYIDYSESWSAPLWRPTDQELQNDYNRAEGKSRVTCAGKRLEGASQYHQVPLRNYPMAPAEKDVWPALNRANALVEGAFQYQYDCNGNDVPGRLEDVTYLAPYDQEGVMPYQNPYGNNIGAYSYQSPPHLNPRDAMPGTDKFVGEYGLQYVNGYVTPSFDDDSNSNGVPYKPDGPNKRPIKNRNHGNINGFTNYSDNGVVMQTEQPDAPPTYSPPKPKITEQDLADIPNPQSLWIKGSRQNELAADIKKIIEGGTLDYLPFSNIPVVRYQPKNAVYDPIEKRITFDAPTSNNRSGETSFNGYPTDIKYTAFDPSIPGDGYDSRTGKVKPWVEEHRKNYWEQRKQIPQQCVNPGADCNTISSWPAVSYGPAPMYSNQTINGIVSKLQPPTMGESETIMQGRANKAENKTKSSVEKFYDTFGKMNIYDEFVPSQTNNYRRVDGSIEVQYNKPNVLMKDGSIPLPKENQIYTGPGPIEREFNGAAAGRSLLNDMKACPTGANRPPGIEITMPDYNLQDPRNTTWGRENKYYGLTAEYARDDASRYRYLRHAPFIHDKDISNGTADCQNATMARRRQRDKQAIDRQISHPNHGLGYLVEELDTYEAWHNEGITSDSVYPL